MLRLRDAAGIIHIATWTYGVWIGRTRCGYTFSTPKNQWQRRTPEGLLIACGDWFGGPRKMTVLEEPAHPDCMTCIVTEARACV